MGAPINAEQPCPVSEENNGGCLRNKKREKEREKERKERKKKRGKKEKKSDYLTNTCVALSRSSCKKSGSAKVAACQSG